jgi:hypothetical protein
MMVCRKAMLYLVVLSFCVLAQGGAFAQPPKYRVVGAGMEPIPYWERLHTIARSGPVRRAQRKQLDESFAKGSNPETLYQTYFQNARRGNDTDSLYISALCAHKIMLSSPDIYSKRMERADAVLHLMNRTPHLPRDYEFVRVRFLLQSQHGWWNSAHSLVKVGPMLLKHQPNDWDVEYRYGYVLKDGSTDSRYLRAYVTKLEQKYPEKKEKLKSLLASVYMVLANKKMDAAARGIEIRLYQEMIRASRLKKQTPRTREVTANLLYLLKAAVELKAAGR